MNEPPPPLKRLRSRALLTGWMLLASLAGCQWCPGPDGGRQGVPGPGAASDPSGPSRASEHPDNGADRKRMLRDAERGQQAMVRCLQSERALTDGNELRCEDWTVIREEFLRR